MPSRVRAPCTALLSRALFPALSGPRAGPEPSSGSVLKTIIESSGKNRMPSDTELKQIIKLAWGSHPQVRLWTNNRGVAKFGDRHVMFGVKGQADLSGILAPNGRRLEIECKSPDDEQSEDQKHFEAMISRFGGLYILAFSLRDCDIALGKLNLHRIGNTK